VFGAGLIIESSLAAIGCIDITTALQTTTQLARIWLGDPRHCQVYANQIAVGRVHQAVGHRTAHSTMKRTVGSSVAGRSEAAMLSDVALKVLAYAVRV
jgi:hypothetical protein